MAELRRTKAGPFKEDTLATLQDLKDALWYFKNKGEEKYLRSLIQPVETGVSHLPKIWVTDTCIDSLCHGAILGIPGIAKLESGIKKDQTVAIMSLKDELVCLGIAKMESKDMLGSKGYAVKTEKVFMIPGTYPKIEKKV
jgi:predicted RNA-binding protein (TIGR00451 family)